MAEPDGNGRDCAATGADLSALLDGELAAPAAAALEAHVRSCPSCADAARDIAAVSRTLRAHGAAEAQVAVSAGFRARVLAEVAGGHRRTAPIPLLAPALPVARWHRWIPVASAAAAAMVVAGAFTALLDGNGSERGAWSSSGRVTHTATARQLLVEAEALRATGDADGSRRRVLGAFGLAPEDAEVRAAFARTMGFDPSALDRRPEPATASGGGPVAVRLPDPPAPGDDGAPSWWIGPARFSSPGAYDEYLLQRQRSHELDLAQAAREAAIGKESRSVARESGPVREREPLPGLLGSLRVGSPLGGGGVIDHGGIAVYPLRAQGAAPPAPGEVLTLADALESGRVEVADSAGRDVGTVLVTNHDPERAVLVLAGEVLVGGRADRMVARDALVPGGARNVPVPVYKVDVSRGAPQSYGSRFRSVAGVAGARLRGLAAGQATPADLAEFVKDRLDLLAVTKSRRSLADAYSERGAASPSVRAVQREVAEITRALLEDPSVRGFAIAQGRELLSVEVFGSHALLAASARRLLEGAALECRTYAGGGASPGTRAVAALLAAAQEGASFRDAGLALPEVGVLALEEGLVGSGVLRGDAVLHAVLFRGAGAGALEGRGARSGDLPGGTPSGGGSGSAGAGTTEGGDGDGSGDGPSSTTGDEGKKPADSSPTSEHPR